MKGLNFMPITLDFGTIITRAAKLTTSAPTTLLTATSRTMVSSVVCTEMTGSSPELTIAKTDGNTTIHYRHQKPMAAKETVVFDTPFVLNPGWSLQVTASIAGAVDAVVNHTPPVAPAH